MGKKAKFGLVTAPRQRPRKRPGRHKKRMNKSEKRNYKKYRGQGRWQTSNNILYYIGAGHHHK